MQNWNRWNSASGLMERIARALHLPLGLFECKALAKRCHDPGLLHLFIEATEK